MSGFIIVGNGPVAANAPAASGVALDHCQQPQPCSLLRMPPEILNRICRAIQQDNTDSTTLPRLARTCQALNRVASAILYTSITIYTPTVPVVSHTLPRILPLQRTLHINDDLANVVRSLSVEVHHPPLPYVPNPPTDVRRFPYYRIALWRLFGIDLAQTNNLQQPVELLMLVCLCPSLRTLDITALTCWRDTDFLLRYTNGRVTGTRHTLHHLKALTIRFHRSPGDRLGAGINLHKLNGLLHATSALTHLSIASAKGGTSLTARLRHLTVLTLHQCLLCARGLRFLLRDCNSLVSVSITHDHAAPVLPGARFLPVSPPQILEYLASSRLTLQSLKMSPWLPPAGHARAAEFAPLTTIGDFPALRRLAVDYRSLGMAGVTDVDVLVNLLGGLDSLEDVLLHGAARDMPGVVFAALADRVLALAWPRLRVVRMGLGPGDGYMLPQGLVDRLRWAMGQGGVAGRVRRMGEVGVRVELFGERL